jgi:hypothetical protein
VEVIGADDATCITVTKSQVDVQGGTTEMKGFSDDEKAGAEPGLHGQEVVGAKDNEPIIKNEDSNQD